MTSIKDVRKGKLLGRFDSAVGAASNSQVARLGAVESIVARPIEGVGPGLVAEPVVSVVLITGINKDSDVLSKSLGDIDAHGLHAIPSAGRVDVDGVAAALVTFDLNTESLFDRG